MRNVEIISRPLLVQNNTWQKSAEQGLRMKMMTSMLKGQRPKATRRQASMMIFSCKGLMISLDNTFSKYDEVKVVNFEENRKEVGEGKHESALERIQEVEEELNKVESPERAVETKYNLIDLHKSRKV